MCFGAGPSFTASAVLAATGTATLTKVRSKKEILFASFPMIFAVQQFIEGMLWLVIRKGEFKQWEHAFTLLYLLFAYIFWPSFSPVSLYLLEPELPRKKKFFPLIILGAGVSLYLLTALVRSRLAVVTVQCNLHYQTSAERPYYLILIYLGATFLPFLLSSYKPVKVLGAINVIFCGIAYFNYYEGFDSVWCFFAAALSINNYLFFAWLRRNRNPCLPLGLGA